MSRKIIKSAAVVSGLTLVSRVLGFVRDMLIARIFGADTATDTFFIAFKIPNFFRRLFAEGAFAQTFVPALIDYERQDDKVGQQDFIDKAGGTLALLLIAATLIGMATAPIFIVVFAPGFLREAELFDLSVQMLRIMLPYLFFIVSVAFAGSILNARGRFGIPALTPVLLNIALIIAAVRIAPLLAEPILALAWAVPVAGAAQLLLQWPALHRAGALPRLRWGFNDVHVMGTLKRMGPAVFAVSVTQINLLLDTFMASFLETGSVSWLYYSDRMVEFPLGILGVALATVILPKLARNQGAQDVVIFSATLDRGLRGVLLLSIPASIGLIVLAEPVLFTLFQYDEFVPADVIRAGRSLMAYALGLMAFMSVKILATGFSAGKNLATPVRYGIYALVANLVLNVLLIVPLAHAGLALATSLAAFGNAGLLLARLLKDGVYRPRAGWAGFALKAVLAGAAMLLILHYSVVPWPWHAWDFSARALHLALSVTLGAGVYWAVLGILGLRFW
ncbi:MAG: murein biosynthesis integral membrane protein MurJ [Gammaproteobacteria bacterium HGW-Gammaproteobacteria-3]|nr:MAG: murein biosynthesis integral membrane protein MurJ [Gammaproteobacteria bacterium HGW-Gammaproteobacteria-3]